MESQVRKVARRTVARARVPAAAASWRGCVRSSRPSNWNGWRENSRDNSTWSGQRGFTWRTHSGWPRLRWRSGSRIGGSSGGSTITSSRARGCTSSSVPSTRPWSTRTATRPTNGEKSPRPSIVKRDLAHPSSHPRFFRSPIPEMFDRSRSRRRAWPWAKDDTRSVRGARCDDSSSSFLETTSLFPAFHPPSVSRSFATKSCDSSSKRIFRDSSWISADFSRGIWRRGSEGRRSCRCWSRISWRGNVRLIQNVDVNRRETIRRSIDFGWIFF